MALKDLSSYDAVDMHRGSERMEIALPSSPTLAGLAFACHIFTGLDSEEEAGRIEAPLDLTPDASRKGLLCWLNEWGCRQFKKEYHDKAARQLDCWHKKEAGSRLFLPENKNLLSLTATDLDTAEKAYDALWRKTASIREVKGKQQHVTFGPTGTAKILFRLRPQALMIWDGQIRDSFGLDGSAPSYRKYLEMGKIWLKELDEECKRHGFGLESLPERMGRSKSSPAKLLDEYLWITVTLKHKPPGRDQLAQWVMWASAVLP
jgi:hypothetical protein